MNTLLMNKPQPCCPLVVLRPPVWRPIVPRLQRAVVAVLVVATLALLAAFSLVGSSTAALGTLTVIELPRVVIHAQRLPTPTVPCPVPVEPEARPCPVPTTARVE